MAWAWVAYSLEVEASPPQTEVDWKRQVVAREPTLELGQKESQPPELPWEPTMKEASGQKQGEELQELEWLVLPRGARVLPQGAMKLPEQ